MMGGSGSIWALIEWFAPIQTRLTEYSLSLSTFVDLSNKSFCPSGQFIQITVIKQLLIDQAAADAKGCGTFADEIGSGIEIDSALSWQNILPV